MFKNHLDKLPRAALLTAVLLVIAPSAAVAHKAAAGHETIGLVLQQKIPEANGKQVTIATVRYAPGQATEAHQHPGSIFAFVTEGAVVSQLDGQPEHTYAKGEGWYEAPGAKHLVSRNASSTKPAALVVWALGDPDQAVKLPLENKQPPGLLQAAARAAAGERSR